MGADDSRKADGNEEAVEEEKVPHAKPAKGQRPQRERAREAGREEEEETAEEEKLIKEEEEKGGSRKDAKTPRRQGKKKEKLLIGEEKRQRKKQRAEPLPSLGVADAPADE